MNKYELASTQEYDEWECSQAKKCLSQILKRLALIQTDGHFGDHKSVSDDDSVWELRWVSGRRIYYAYIKELKILLLLGGNKNGQKKDIARALGILAKRNSP